MAHWLDSHPTLEQRIRRIYGRPMGPLPLGRGDEPRPPATATPAAPGVTQHIAFNCDTDEELHAMRDRIRSRGVRVLGPLDPGFGKAR